MFGIVGAVCTSKSTANAPVYQKPFCKYDVAVLVQVTINFQAVSEVHGNYSFQEKQVSAKAACREQIRSPHPGQDGFFSGSQAPASSGSQAPAWEPPFSGSSSFSCK
jgi:hypothetical protein